MKGLFFCFIALLYSFNIFAQNTELNLSKGRDLASKEEYNLAIHHFDLAIQEDSTCFDAFIARAYAYNKLGDFNKALKDYNYVLIKKPKCPECYFGMAVIYDFWKDEKYLAICYFTKAIELYLENKDENIAGNMYFMRAGIKEELGDKKGYWSDLEKGAKLNTLVKDMYETFLEIEKREKQPY